MSLSRRIARPLLGSIFLSSAIPMLKDQSYLHGPIRDAGLSEPELLAKAHVYGNLVGGAALALGRFPRLAAVGLAANLVPTTYVGHAFWSAPEDQKVMQQINFFKNVSILGGLLLAAFDTDGRESLPHAVGRVSRSATKKANKAAAKAGKKANKAAGSAQKKLPTR
jgi:uncharacterized membrane protein YphA (DoxX/SURF4 family)